jgi:signal transduction histidine kinase
VFAGRYLTAVAAATVTTTIEAAVVVRGDQGGVYGLIAFLLLIVAAALLARDEEQRGNALLLELGAIAAAASELDEALGRAGLQLGFTVHYWAVVLLGWFFLRYPDQVIRDRWHRWLLGWLAVWGVLGWAIDSVLWDPTRVGSAEPNDWVTIGNWNGLRDQVQLWSVWATTLGLLATVVAMVQRWAAAKGLDRVAVRSVAAVGILLALVVAVTEWLYWIYSRYVVADLPNLGRVREAALGIAVATVLFEALRRRSASVAVVDALFGAGDDTSRVLAVLRRAFADPALTVNLEDATAPADGRVALPLLGRDGEQIGVVDTDATAMRDPAWSRTVLAAAGVVIENARLHDSVLESLAEVRTSRARLVEAGLDERRRVERDLHDGAQQHLLAVASSLGRLELVDDDAARTRALEDAKSQLATALAELRNLARGIYPPVLNQAGLGAALRTLSDTTLVPVRVEIDASAERRYRSAVESTAWFVACEAVANAVKHADATCVSVTLGSDSDFVRLRVSDDGCGGATAADGGGLAGLLDRVRALGGDLDVRSETGVGTVVTAAIPVS